MPRIFMPLGDATEALDTFYPYFRLQEDGYEVVVAGPEARLYHTVLHEIPPDSNVPWDITQERPGYFIKATQAFRDCRGADFAGAFVSGGRAPEYIRYNEDLLRVMRELHDAGKPIACVCHGIEILTAAGIIGGRTVTTVPKCKLDAEQGGAKYVDQPVVLDGNLVTSRYWMDNHALLPQFLKMLKGRKNSRALNSEPPMHHPRAVVFDLDGLMFNTEELYQEVGAELLRRRGYEFTEELLDQMMGRPSGVALQIMIDTHTLKATVEELLAETDEIFPGILKARLAPMPGLLELLAKLEAHQIPKGIATSSRRSFVEHVLGVFQFEPRFSHILTSEDITQGKPHPEIYLLAASRLGIAPGEMLVLEDSQNGCRAAVAAGAIAVAVPGDHSRRHDFTGAALVADTLGDQRIEALLGIANTAAAKGARR